MHTQSMVRRNQFREDESQGQTFDLEASGTARDYALFLSCLGGIFALIENGYDCGAVIIVRGFQGSFSRPAAV